MQQTAMATSALTKILSTLFLTYLLGFQDFALIFSVQSSQLLQRLFYFALHPLRVAGTVQIRLSVFSG